MTNVSGPGKVEIRRFLRERAIAELRKQGYAVDRVPRAGKGSLRKITKDGVSKIATIRTSQDAWFAFPRNETDTGWSTLEDADVVVVASLTEKGGNTANFHMFDADDVRARFDRAREAKLKAGHEMPLGRGVWISLYGMEMAEPVSMVGAGAGNIVKPFAANVPVLTRIDPEYRNDDEPAPEMASATDQLSIPEAKRRLAATFGVSPDDVKITIEG